MTAPLTQRIANAFRDQQPLLMGVVNVTPDSFSDGGRFDRPEAAITHALELLEQGADILDIGGESTRPGAQSVAGPVELDRVIPVIEGIRALTDAPISIDTSKPEVMRAAVRAGADMINDVNALRAPGATRVAAELAVPVCLMHMQGEPRTMQKNPRYQRVVDDILAFFGARVSDCLAAGVCAERIVLDPGFGFGKTLTHNLELLAGLAGFRRLGHPVLAGLSRKSMLGAITGRERPDQRISASVAAALIAAQRGATIIRVHDMAATVDALNVWLAVRAVDASQGQPE
ncbi:MAG: dihydropteroate synthase [Wenzhouxiangella sp.]|nr:MAG: dihydropteroate synthase [Wenzhouxiangella sp.]